MKKTVKTNTVTDEHGRVRFHGAFTGGFSAGYYNTVGSAEGFQPAQFVSSRSNRAARNTQSVVDYMDEGDGLLGGKLSSVAGVDSFTTATGSAIGRVTNSGDLGEVVSGMVVQQQSDTIGRKLLAAMGWRLGQGVGPRVPRKRLNYFDSERNYEVDVELHPGADLSKVPVNARSKTGSVTFAPDDEAQKIVYPPTKLDFFGIGFDVRKSGSLHIDDDNHEYDNDAYEQEDKTRYVMSSSLASRNAGGRFDSSLMKRPALTGPGYGQQKPPEKRLKFSSGFAYDDAEDDVYGDNTTLRITNNLSAGKSSGAQAMVPYQFSNEVQEVDIADGVEIRASEHQQKYAELSRETLGSIQQRIGNWLGGDDDIEESNVMGNLRAVVEQVERCPSDNKPPLPGFHVARMPRSVPPHYPGPIVPSDFVPFHRFSEDDISSSQKRGEEAQHKPLGRKLAPFEAARARSHAMNAEASTYSSGDITVNSDQTSKPASIFDLMKPEARYKLQAVLDSVNPNHNVRIAANPPLPPEPVPLPPPPQTLPVSSVLSSSDTSMISSVTAAPERPMLTNSALLNSTFAGLSQAFKNRFAAATTVEGAGGKDSIVVEGMATATEYSQIVSEKQRALEAKMAASNSNPSAALKPALLRGSLRSVLPWAPSPLLCKRMNIKLPDISKISVSSTQSESAPLDPFSHLLGVPVAPPITAFGKPGTESIAVGISEEDATHADVYIAETVEKPPISFFKSIFENSNSDGVEELKEEEIAIDKRQSTEEMNADAAASLLASIEGPLIPNVGMAPVVDSFNESVHNDTSVVRFVPRKMRATAATTIAPSSSQPRKRVVRTTMVESDVDSEDGKGRNAHENVTESNLGDLPSGVEDQYPPKAARSLSQRVVGIGGSGGNVSFRARSGQKGVAKGSLRERLLAQRIEQEYEDLKSDTESSSRLFNDVNSIDKELNDEHVGLSIASSGKDAINTAVGKSEDSNIWFGNENCFRQNSSTTPFLQPTVLPPPTHSSEISQQSSVLLPENSRTLNVVGSLPATAPDVALLPNTAVYSGPALTSSLHKLQASLQYEHHKKSDLRSHKSQKDDKHKHHKKDKRSSHHKDKNKDKKKRKTSKKSKKSKKSHSDEANDSEESSSSNSSSESD